MANIDNLVLGGEAHALTVQEASKGGKASAEARRRKRDLRAALELLLERETRDSKGNTVSGAQAISARLYAEALRGNVRAFEVLRDTVGQKPVEKVMLAEVDQAVINEVEQAVLNGQTNSD